MTPSGRTIVEGQSIFDVQLMREKSLGEDLRESLDAKGRASPHSDDGQTDVDRLIARHESRDLRTVGVFDVKASKAPPLLKVSESTPDSPLLQHSTVASVQNVRRECINAVPGWHLIPGGAENLEVHQRCAISPILRRLTNHPLTPILHI